MNVITPTNSPQIYVADFVRVTSRLKTAAANLIIGRSYIILYVGTTNFIAGGASSNTVGVSFIATVSYLAGTGYVYEPTVTRLTTAPTAITVPQIDAQPFTGVGQLMQIGSATRDIKSTANETTFSLVGIDTANLGLVLSQDIKGSGIEAWHGFFSNSGQLLANYLQGANTFTNAAWWDAVNLVVTTDSLTTGVTVNGTYYLSDKAVYSAAGAYFGQSVEAGAPISGRTFNFSVYLRTSGGAVPTNFTLRIRDAAGTNIYDKPITVTQGQFTRYDITYTFPSTAVNNFFYVQVTTPAPVIGVTGGNTLWTACAQVTETAAVNEFVYTTSAAITGVYKFFTGTVNSFAITEEWIEEVRKYTGVITVSASSIQLIFQNRIAGRYTNDSSWQYHTPSDTSMNRVAFVSTIDYMFGKGATADS